MDRSHTVLVACAASKHSGAHEARDLYDSTLFREARNYAEREADRWYILSALHGLLDPLRVVEPYERTLNRMAIAVRRNWAARVNDRLLQVLGPNERVTILAGQRYREFVEPFLRQHGFDVHVPLAGLRIGEQVQWLQRTNAYSRRSKDAR